MCVCVCVCGKQYQKVNTIRHRITSPLDINFFEISLQKFYNLLKLIFIVMIERLRLLTIPGQKLGSFAYQSNLIIL